MQDTQEQQHTDAYPPQEQSEESPVIEGEVITTIMLDPPSITALPQKRSSLRQQTFMVSWAIVTLLLLGILVSEHIASLVAVFLAPTATITISPNLVTLQEAYPIAVLSHRLTVTSPTLTTTMRTTGIGYIPATQAHGLLTFYNAATYEQTIAAGTVVTGNDGIEIVTDEAAYVPAGNPPNFGIATVSSHTLQAGTRANILEEDINILCCVAGISVKNTENFTGGVNAQSYPMVSQNDIENASRSFISTLTQSAAQSLHRLVKASEEIATQTCNLTRTANPTQGERASIFTVLVSVTCQASVYPLSEVNDQVAPLLEKKAIQTLSSQYREIGSATTSVVTITAIRGNTIRMVVKANETWGYLFSSTQLHQLANRVKGKRVQEANTLLLSIPGVRNVRIVSENVLPTNPDQIQISEFVE